MRTFTISSDLDAAPEVVWRHITTMDGVNDEMAPLMRMTAPASMRAKTLDDVDLGRPLGRSWLLLLGVLPVDYDDLSIVEREPGHRFLERSAMLTQSRWEHERTVTAVPRGCRVTDTLAWEGRLAPLGAMYRLAVPVLFAHRHRRLRRRFGGGTYD